VNDTGGTAASLTYGHQLSAEFNTRNTNNPGFNVDAHAPVESENKLTVIVIDTGIRSTVARYFRYPPARQPQTLSCTNRSRTPHEGLATPQRTPGPLTLPINMGSLVSTMKTTVELPDDLYRTAKSRAAERGVSFRSFLIDALRSHLHEKTGADALNGIFGILAQEPEAVYAVDRTVERDLEQVDPDEWR